MLEWVNGLQYLDVYAERFSYKRKALKTQMETIRPKAPVREWTLLAPRAASLAAACVTPEGFTGFY